MFASEFLPIITSFLLVMLMVYLWVSRRNIIKNKALTPQEYLWKLKCITGKSEYDLFHIAAEEKGWPKYQADKHFRRYLEDQTLPGYVKEFLEDGKDHINTYRPRGGDFIDKKLLIFYSLFALVMIGGSLVLCLYVIPRIYNLENTESYGLAKVMETSSQSDQPSIKPALSYEVKGKKLIDIIS